MMIFTCDICKEVIQDRSRALDISLNSQYYYSHFSLCKKCSEPVVNFLKSHELIGDAEAS